MSEKIVLAKKSHSELYLNIFAEILLFILLIIIIITKNYILIFPCGAFIVLCAILIIKYLRQKEILLFIENDFLFIASPKKYEKISLVSVTKTECSLSKSKITKYSAGTITIIAEGKTFKLSNVANANTVQNDLKEIIDLKRRSF